MIPKVVFTEVDCKKLPTWAVENPSNPSFWHPDYHRHFFSGKNTPPFSKTFGDLVFDGVEITTNNKEEIIELGGMPYLLDKKRRPTETISWPQGICAKVRFKDLTLGETVLLDEIGDQDVFYSPETHIVKWIFDKTNPSDKYLKIAQNVILGIRNNRLHEILGMVS